MEEEQQLKTGPEMGSREVLVWAVAVVVLLTRSLLGWGQQGTLQWTVGLYQVTFSWWYGHTQQGSTPQVSRGTGG
jgi:hypothetical protein